MLKTLTLILMSAFFYVSALAGPNHQPPKMPKDFETLKQLIGTWEGSSKMGDKEEKMTVTYELTSGGTAITEKLMPGSPHEMTSIYHKEGNSLAMTHYCALGNQPHMPLKNSKPNSLAFEMTKPIGISSPNESHMHAVTLTWDGPNHLKQEWVNFENGKKNEVVVFNLERKK